jgi:acetyl/propionyl-CoA carboxylase alpha subunit
MIKAIDGYLVEGVETTAFRKFVCEHEAFRSGRILTHFCEKIL